MESKKNYFNPLEGFKYKLDDFKYDLPEELIAQYPLQERDSARLLVVNREDGKLAHQSFRDIVKYLKEGDCLVLNDTRVFPARLLGKKDKTGAGVEVFLLRNLDANTWEVLVKPARKVRIGNKIVFGDKLHCDVVDNTLSGGRIVEFSCNGNFFKILEEVGNTPLPPYIKRNTENIDKTHYQTVYADKPGAVAAPTAGLHFTEDLMKKIKSRGINIATLTLHVGLGTFRPVQVEDISRHKMDSEYYEVTTETAQLINRTHSQKGNVVAVGTTSVRVLETVADQHGLLRSGRGWTNKFIYPPYDFKVVDKLLTNFHLPCSTLLMLVSAFSSLDLMKNAYQAAIDQRYRFFSYGDAMLIL
ncbi:MAG: tRNA preQ1(34) S-adenosylmethionine ribosyltransferase-isomerase QueA [Calditrichia bacterium]